MAPLVGGGLETAAQLGILVRSRAIINIILSLASNIGFQKGNDRQILLNFKSSLSDRLMQAPPR